MKIAVLSDTHGLLRPEVLQKIGSCDVCLHAGDVHTQEVYERLAQVCPLYAVLGNNDSGMKGLLPASLLIQLGGLHFYMVHNKADIPKQLTDIDIVIFGHSHQYLQEIREGRIFLNPGSCGKRRFRLALTMAIVHVDAEGYWIEKVILEEEKGRC